MPNSPHLTTSRRNLLVRTGLVGAAVLLGAGWRQQPRVFSGEVHHDPGCGCCHVWIDIMRKSGRFNLKVVEDQAIGAYKDKLRVPQDLRSCHTALIEGKAFEGHVPVEDMLKLLQDSASNAIGLAVPGMPRGSPGMEMSSGVRDAYSVVAFFPTGQPRIFSQYAARG